MQGEKKKGGEILEEDFTFAYEKFLMDCTLGSKINLIIRAEAVSYTHLTLPTILRV